MNVINCGGTEHWGSNREETTPEDHQEFTRQRWRMERELERKENKQESGVCREETGKKQSGTA